MSLASRASVIICAYTFERWAYLREGVRAAAGEAPLEIIVVIDHNDDLLRHAQLALAPHRVIPNTDLRGASGARNSALAIARGEFAVFLDDDACPQPGWLETLLSAYSSANVLGIGGFLEPRWETERPTWFPPEFDWVIGCSYVGLPVAAARVRNVIAANMTVRMNVIRQVGGFQSTIGRLGKIPLGGEETELAIRASQHWPAGYWWYEPAARARHFVPAARGTWRYFLNRCFAEGVSKAQIARLVGATSALSSETSYVRRTLPRGVLREGRALIGGNRHAAGRLVALIAGTVWTAAGYVYGQRSGNAAAHR